MRALRLTTLALLTGAFAVGCSDQTAPTTPRALAEDGLSTGDPSLDSRTRNPVIHQAQANSTNDTGPLGLRKFHFSAYEHADGTTRGRMYVNNPNSQLAGGLIPNVAGNDIVSAVVIHVGNRNAFTDTELTTLLDLCRALLASPEPGTPAPDIA